MNQKILTKKIRLSGYVQGVGMRYFITHTAESNQIGGTVQNLDNGDVECIAQGYESQINQFIEDIKSGHPGTIDEFHISDLNDQRVYNHFAVKLY